MLQFATTEQRWNAVVANNLQADGAFFYAVETTGIYCRPTCRSRRPKPENVRFFQTIIDAEAAGFRPCKRCQPQMASPQADREQLIGKICQAIEASTENLSLSELAQMANLSPDHFHRIFKQIVGVTPKQYLTACRNDKIRDRLHQDRSITEAIFAAGYESSSQFYTQSPNILGMTPTEYKQGARDRAIQFAVAKSNLGWVIVAATEVGICAIALGDTPEQSIDELQIQFPQAKLSSDDSIFQQWVADVVMTIDNPQRGLNLPLDIRGTAFQSQVWQALQTIPIGSTLSYQQVADRIGKPTAARAVAAACAANKLAIAIPCHRVVGSNGSLSGYRWGVERKQALLELEKNPQQNHRYQSID